MPREIDSRIADHLVSTALSSLGSPRGNNVICTRRALDAALLAAIREAHEIGFLAGQQERFAYVTSPGSPHRPAWMDIRFDDPEELRRRGIRIGPTVLKALAAAGYRRLGDLRWVSELQLRALHYVGIKTARALRAIVRRFEEAEPSSEGGGQPAQPIADPSPIHRRSDHRPPLYSKLHPQRASYSWRAWRYCWPMSAPPSPRAGVLPVGVTVRLLGSAKGLAANAMTDEPFRQRARRYRFRRGCHAVAHHLEEGVAHGHGRAVRRRGVALLQAAELPAPSSGQRFDVAVPCARAGARLDGTGAVVA